MLDTNNDGTDEIYRVLNMNGTNAKLLAMDNLNNSTYRFYNGGQEEYATFSGSGNYIAYANSLVDTALTTWYNGLHSTVKNAIQDTMVTQNLYMAQDSQLQAGLSYDYSYEYNWSNPDHYVWFGGSTIVGNRKVFLLGVEDIFEYYGKSIINSNELNDMFWGTSGRTQENDTLWLNSAAVATSNTCLWTVNGFRGTLNHDSLYSNYIFGVRAAFVIDLSQVTYTVAI